jgi:serine/threonine-protein kinase
MPATIDDRLIDLIAQWEELRRQGNDADPTELCADCPELAAALDQRIRLLRAINSALDIGYIDLQPPADDHDFGATSADRKLPERLRAEAVYKPKQYYARGGLGEVLTAREEGLDRTIALKRIRPDKLHDSARQRFLREAAITAKLQHPGIVPIYGLGHDDAGPFYSMPLIQGQTLQEACEEFHRDDTLARDAGQRSVKLRKLLQQFITVCNTLAYSHDQGVVHRDLKPSNIMLGAYGEVLVLDWGLAKQFATDGTALEPEEHAPSPSPSADDLTATGAIMGTPRYMSPEQAKGEPVGPGSDIFNLGLMLYEILTGRSALDDSTFRSADWLNALVPRPIVPPRSANESMPRALEAICKKALAARPEDRYTSARQLAKDLENWLADEPVSACDEGWSQRVARWTRRHRAWVQAGAAASLLVTIISVIAAIRIDSALRQAKSKAAETNLQRQRSAQNFGAMMDGITNLVTVARQRRPGQSADLAIWREHVSTQAVEILTHYLDEKANDPSLRMETAYAHQYLGSLYDMLGNHAKAMDELGAAIRVCEQLTRDAPTDAIHQVQLGQLTNARAHSLVREDRDAGLKMYRRAGAAFRKAVELDPENARATNFLAWFLLVCPDERLRDTAEAVVWARRSIAASQGPEQSRAWNTLGVAYYRQANWRGAIEAVENSCRLSPTGGNDVDYFLLAMAHWQLGDPSSARKYYAEGERWVTRSRTRGGENTEFYREASKLLGVADSIEGSSSSNSAQP